MFSIFSAIGSLLGGPITAITGQIAGYFTSAKTVEGSEFAAMTSAERDEFVAYTQAVTNLNAAKAANNWWGAHLMVYLFGLPAAIHWSAVFIVSCIPAQFNPWMIPAAPKEYAGAEMQIALSFFILAPALPIISGLASRLRS